MNVKPILLLSIALNVALLGAVAYLATRKPDAPAPVAKAPISVVRNKLVEVPVEKEVEVKTVKSVDWRQVESDDYKKYIANLRSIGCPEETIRDIITADVNKLFDARKKEMRNPANEFKFWQTGRQAFAQFMNEDVMKQNQELAQEKRTLLKELLGVAPEEKADPFGIANAMDAMLGFLPTGKQAQVMELEQKYQSKMMKAVGGGGAPDAQDMKNLREAMREKDAEMAKLLTPQEYEDYQLRMSQTSMMMRMQLDGFEPSEKEFRDIFKLQKSFDDEFGLMGMGGNNKEEREKREAAQKELDANLKQVIGDERFMDMQREKDYAYKAISKVAQREGLPRESAVKVFDMKKIAEQQANKVRSDPNLSAEQRTAALRGIRQETERSMQGVLGEKGFSSYKGNQGASYWLRGISPDPNADQ